jgi:hypothetical protein
MYELDYLSEIKSDPKSTIIVNINSHLDSQNFIGYESAYRSYNFFY